METTKDTKNTKRGDEIGFLQKEWGGNGNGFKCGLWDNNRK